MTRFTQLAALLATTLFALPAQAQLFNPQIFNPQSPCANGNCGRPVMSNCPNGQCNFNPLQGSLFAPASYQPMPGQPMNLQTNYLPPNYPQPNVPQTNYPQLPRNPVTSPAGIADNRCPNGVCNNCLNGDCRNCTTGGCVNCPNGNCNRYQPLPGTTNYDYNRPLPTSVPQYPPVQQIPVTPQSYPDYRGPSAQLTSGTNRRFRVPTSMSGIARLPMNEQYAALDQQYCPVTRTLLGSNGCPVAVNVYGRTYYAADDAAADQLYRNPSQYLQTGQLPYPNPAPVQFHGGSYDIPSSGNLTLR